MAMDPTHNHPWKTRNQLARAHKLVDVIDALPGPHSNSTRLAFAESLTAAKWADVAFLAGITAPSATTVAMAVGILETRCTNDHMTEADIFAGWGLA